MKDRIFKIGLCFSAIISLLLIAGILYSLITQSLPAMQHFGFLDFITSTEWDSRETFEKYGALTFIYGTVYTALLALFISIPFSLSLTILIGEYFAGTKFASFLSNIIHIFANIPSIIFGIWGYYSLRPFLISLDIDSQGLGIFTASCILAAMITPITSSLCISFISKVPSNIKNAAYSLGATQYDVINKICFPYVKKEIFGSYLLALGKALGETIIIVILIGNNNHIPATLMDTGNTLSSIILLQFGSASDLKFSSLYAIGLLLFLITAIVNLIAKNMLKGFNYESK